MRKPGLRWAFIFVNDPLPCLCTLYFWAQPNWEMAAAARCRREYSTTYADIITYWPSDQWGCCTLGICSV